jgi:predicted DNA-binding transcriptional regulator YafY
VAIKKSRKKFWKLLRVSDIFEEFINNSYDLTNLFDLAQSFDPEIFKELEKGTLSKIAKSNEQVFFFKNSIMEELKSQRVQEIFKSLKVAIKNYEYRDIVYRYDEVMVHKNVKCIKLMFVGNNWYLMAVDEDEKLLFRRLSFIEEVNYAKKSNFRAKEVEEYINFLKTVQNPMTMYGVKPKIATIKATAHVAKYFEKGMKPLLSSQKFVKKCDDGSVMFTLEYTQELEILPSIQRWLPDLVIVEPLELREAYRKKLELAMGNH